MLNLIPVDDLEKIFQGRFSAVEHYVTVLSPLKIKKQTALQRRPMLPNQEILQYKNQKGQQI